MLNTSRLLALRCVRPSPNQSSVSLPLSTAQSVYVPDLLTAATTGLPAAVATACSSKPSAISKECSCYYTGGAVAIPTTTAKSTTLATSVKTSAVATATGGGSAGTCGTPNYTLYGYGAGTTGGGTGTGTTVTTCAALIAAAKSAGVIVISGIISGCGVVDLVGDTTVRGVGANSGKSLLDISLSLWNLLLTYSKVLPEAVSVSRNSPMSFFAISSSMILKKAMI